MDSTRSALTTLTARSKVGFCNPHSYLIGQTQKILELNSTVIELREVITQKRDVEAQLDRARD